ncbi:hypothetical protein Nepgr_019832 [Nepenthes gracilis]|uniref:RRM domain-containing protein n=1 Tax=Nepenthes gracilis TaxID=150966 RepID=A0AAD3SXT5_NEPGR|nr:hypothetical protein Nepgr_019832 [Nepenthes gracilis]
MVDSERGKLFVGGISWETSEDILRDHFTQYGEVSSSVIAKDRITGSPRGFGFVTFVDPSSADKALDDQHVIEGRTVEVKKAIPRSEQQQNSQKQHHHQQNSKDLGRNSNGSYGGNNNDEKFRTKKIFVGGLSANLTEEEFKNYFERFGRITDVVVMHDSMTNRPRGFGFITFDSEEVVETIMQKNFHQLGGKLVEVKRAIPKEMSRNGNNGGNSRVIGGEVSSFAGYPHSVRHGIYPGQVPFSPYAGILGYYYGGGYGGGYPMGGYISTGYGLVRNPWNGLGMLGVGSYPFAATAVYSTDMNSWIDGTVYSGVIENSKHDINDQVLDNAAATQIEGGKLDVHNSSLESRKSLLYSKKNQKTFGGQSKLLLLGHSS